MHCQIKQIGGPISLLGWHRSSSLRFKSCRSARLIYIGARARERDVYLHPTERVRCARERRDSVCLPAAISFSTGLSGWCADRKFLERQRRRRKQQRAAAKFNKHAESLSLSLSLSQFIQFRGCRLKEFKLERLRCKGGNARISRTPQRSP